jgi:hypothetical protein
VAVQRAQTGSAIPRREKDRAGFWWQMFEKNREIANTVLRWPDRTNQGKLNIETHQVAENTNKIGCAGQFISLDIEISVRYLLSRKRKAFSGLRLQPP